MDNIGYVALSRQSGLTRAMNVVANNIANSSTTGFRREGVVFSEHVKDLAGPFPSLSIGHGNGRALDMSQGALTQTGGTFDFAIEGPGFFLLETTEGPRLTRNGAFGTNPEGELVSAEGFRVLDEGGAPAFVPVGSANISLAADGTLSSGEIPLAKLAIVMPVDALDLPRQGGVLFDAPNGVDPVAGPKVLQGFLEGSNVNPVTELTRMIHVQRAYELGQNFMQQEDERVRNVVRTLGQ